MMYHTLQLTDWLVENELQWIVWLVLAVTVLAIITVKIVQTVKNKKK